MLAFVFASLLALLPLLIAAVSILTTFLLLLPLTYATDVSFIVQFLVALIGLGIAIDYSLLLVTRWREERDRGATNEAAVIRAVEMAGHTVAVSGVTVANRRASPIAPARPRPVTARSARLDAFLRRFRMTASAAPTNSS